MHRAVNSGISLVIVLLVVAGTALLSSSALAETVLSAATGSNATTTGTSSLDVTARMPRLAPGLRASMDVSVTNTSADQRIQIAAVQVRVGDASPACLADNLAVTEYSRLQDEVLYLVEPGATVVVPLPVTMVDKPTNQDGCKGASFPVRYDVATAAAR